MFTADYWDITMILLCFFSSILAGHLNLREKKEKKKKLQAATRVRDWTTMCSEIDRPQLALFLFSPWKPNEAKIKWKCSVPAHSFASICHCQYSAPVCVCFSSLCAHISCTVHYYGVCWLIVTGAASPLACSRDCAATRCLAGLQSPRARIMNPWDKSALSFLPWLRTSRDGLSLTELLCLGPSNTRTQEGIKKASYFRATGTRTGTATLGTADENMSRETEKKVSGIERSIEETKMWWSESSRDALNFWETECT